jgi:hypothetical protein
LNQEKKRLHRIISEQLDKIYFELEDGMKSLNSLKNPKRKMGVFRNEKNEVIGFPKAAKELNLDSFIIGSKIDEYGVRLDSVNSLKAWETLIKLGLVVILIVGWSTLRTRGLQGCTNLGYIWCGFIALDILLLLLILYVRTFGNDRKSDMILDNQMKTIQDVNRKVGDYNREIKSAKKQHEAEMETERRLNTEASNTARFDIKMDKPKNDKKSEDVVVVMDVPKERKS